jgi:hypothetical protein
MILKKCQKDQILIYNHGCQKIEKNQITGHRTANPFTDSLMKISSSLRFLK